jgi:hypothetical protein
MGRADIALVLLLPEVVDYISILFRKKEESACDGTEPSHWNKEFLSRYGVQQSFEELDFSEAFLAELPTVLPSPTALGNFFPSRAS